MGIFMPKCPNSKVTEKQTVRQNGKIILEIKRLTILCGNFNDEWNRLHFSKSGLPKF